MKNPLSKIQDHVNVEHLHPGHIIVTKEPTCISTILGSCVAICLHDPSLNIGGMAHYLLAHGASDDDNSSKYGNFAIISTIKKLTSLGAAHHTLQAKIFGGSCVLKSYHREKRHLGDDNVEFALTELLRFGINIIAKDVGGFSGRKVIYETHTGIAWVKTI